MSTPKSSSRVDGLTLGPERPSSLETMKSSDHPLTSDLELGDKENSKALEVVSAEPSLIQQILTLEGQERSHPFNPLFPSSVNPSVGFSQLTNLQIQQVFLFRWKLIQNSPTLDAYGMLHDWIISEGNSTKGLLNQSQTHGPLGSALFHFTPPTQGMRDNERTFLVLMSFYLGLDFWHAWCKLLYQHSNQPQIQFWTELLFSSMTELDENTPSLLKRGLPELLGILYSRDDEACIPIIEWMFQKFNLDEQLKWQSLGLNGLGHAFLFRKNSEGHLVSLGMMAAALKGLPPPTQTEFYTAHPLLNEDQVDKEQTIWNQFCQKMKQINSQFTISPWTDLTSQSPIESMNVFQRSEESSTSILKEESESDISDLSMAQEEPSLATESLVDNPYLNSDQATGYITTMDPVCEVPIFKSKEHEEDLMAYSNLWKAVSRIGVPNSWESNLWLLQERFPWMDKLIHEVRQNVRLQVALHAPFKLPPYLLIGPPGVGKTRFVRELAKALEIPFSSYSVSGSADNRFLQGTAYGWGTGIASWPVEKMCNLGLRNPWLMLDEIEKTDEDVHNGRVWDSLLTLLEKESAARMMDEYLRVPVDTSGITWWACANEIGRLPGPLLSRFKQHQVGVPDWKNAEHIKAACWVALEDWLDEHCPNTKKRAEMFPKEKQLAILDILQEQDWSSLRSLQKGVDVVIKIFMEEMLQQRVWVSTAPRLH